MTKPFAALHQQATAFCEREGHEQVNTCCGSCNQGRTQCPSPDACQLPIEETPLGWWARIKRAFYWFVADVESWR